MKKPLVLGAAFLLLVLVSGCEVTPGSGYGGSYGGFYGEYPDTYSGTYYAPAYPYYGYGYGYAAPFDRDHYWDREHWGRHDWDEHGWRGPERGEHRHERH